MIKSLCAIVLAIAVTGCGKSKCETYGDMEVKCGGYPEKEREITRAMATAMCSNRDDNGGDLMKEVSAKIAAEADCAAKTTDCAEYKKCTAPLK